MLFKFMHKAGYRPDKHARTNVNEQLISISVNGKLFIHVSLHLFAWILEFYVYKYMYVIINKFYI